MKIIKNNIRYILALAVIGLVFLIGKSFPAEIIKTENCTKGKCLEILGNILSDENPSFFANDVFSSGESGKEYYRLTFRERSDKDSKILIKKSNVFDQEEIIGNLEIKSNLEYGFQEIIFFTENKKTDMVFEKEKKDGSRIEINDVKISKLDISNDKEILKLGPTVFGQNNYSEIDQKQTDNSEYFSRLSELKIIFGQTFHPQFDYITGVSLSLDIVKQDDWKTDQKYRLELREAENDYGIPKISNDILTKTNFTLDNLENFRQSDGTFKFPLFSKLEPGKNYFIGISNDRVDVNRFNYLKLRGSLKDTYEDGSTLVKYKGQAYFSPGDLYFATYGIKFKELEEKKILQGTIIEDLGGKKGVFNYQTSGKIYDLADLDSYTEDVFFDEDESVVGGSDKPDLKSEFIYKFETIYPFSKIRISGKQPNSNWSRAAIYFSYDGKIWTKIPEQKKEDNFPGEEPQFFNYEQAGINSKDTVYIKISPENNFLNPNIKSNNYGIKDLHFEAELLM